VVFDEFEGLAISFMLAPANPFARKTLDAMSRSIATRLSPRRKSDRDAGGAFSRSLSIFAVVFIALPV
jgi:hypothetical protein